MEDVAAFGLSDIDTAGIVRCGSGHRPGLWTRLWSSRGERIGLIPVDQPALAADGAPGLLADAWGELYLRRQLADEPVDVDARQGWPPGQHPYSGPLHVLVVFGGAESVCKAALWVSRSEVRAAYGGIPVLGCDDVRALKAVRWRQGDVILARARHKELVDMLLDVPVKKL
jgi:hypothetical protein